MTAQIVEDASAAPRKVGLMLAVGIFLVPAVFAWFTLRRGHSWPARILALAWLGLVVWFWVWAATDDTPAPPPKAPAAAAPIQPAGRDSADGPPGLNDKVKVGSAAVTLTRVAVHPSIGARDLKPASGKVWVSVDYWIDNRGYVHLAMFEYPRVRLVGPDGQVLTADAEMTKQYLRSSQSYKITPATTRPVHYPKLLPVRLGVGDRTLTAQVFEAPADFNPDTWKAQVKDTAHMVRLR